MFYALKMYGFAVHVEKNSVIQTKQDFLLFLDKGVLVNYCASMRESGTDCWEFQTSDAQLCPTSLILNRTANA